MDVYGELGFGQVVVRSLSFIRKFCNNIALVSQLAVEVRLSHLYTVFSLAWCQGWAMDAKRRNGGPVMGGASQAKRSKVGGEWDDGPSIFEEELAMLDEVEMEGECREGQAGHDVIPVGELPGMEGFLSCAWRR